VVIKQEIEIPVLKLEKKASSDKKEKLNKLNAKLEKLNEKKEKLKKKCSKKQVAVLAVAESIPKMLEEVAEKKPEYFVFAGVEKSMNRVSQEYVDGKLTMQEFTSAWNNEATILKKKVCWMKAEAMKKQ
jgi:predicted RNA-binding protein